MRFHPWAELTRLPSPVQYAAFFYLGHVFCQGWIASSQIFIGLSVIATLVALWKGQLAFRFEKIYLPVSFYVLGSWLSAAFGNHRGRAFLQAGEWFNFLALGVALILYARRRELTDATIRFFAFLVTFLAIYGLFQYFVLGHRDLEHRITGPTAHVMTFSGILMPLTLYLLILWFDQRRLAWLLAGGLGSFALLLTFTRGAWLGWLAGAVAFVAIRQKRWLVWAVPILMIALLVSPLSIFARLTSVFDTRQSSNFDRIRMVQAGIEMIKDRPLFGVGPSNIKEMYPLYRLPDAPRTRVPHLHNNVVQVWAERGVICLGAYLFLIGYFLQHCVRAREAGGEQRTFADAGFAAVVALTLAGLFEFNFGDTEVLLTMLDLMALTLVRSAVEQERWPSSQPQTMGAPLEPSVTFS